MFRDAVRVMAKKNKISSGKMCYMLGGDFDRGDETCDIPMRTPDFPRSVLKKGMMKFYMIQMAGGVISSVTVTFLRNTRFPSTWWTTFPLLLLVSFIAFMMWSFKMGSSTEALARTVLSVVIIYSISVVVGIIYEWDLFIYLELMEFARFPTASTIAGMGVASLMSVILIRDDERKDDLSNDLSGGGTLAIFENT